MNGARRLRFRALQKTHIGSVDPDALKIPARRAECSLTESALSPFQAEPTQMSVILPVVRWSARLFGLAITVVFVLFMIGEFTQP